MASLSDFKTAQWPKLEKNELVSFYYEIKANKVYNLKTSRIKLIYLSYLINRN